MPNEIEPPRRVDLQGRINKSIRVILNENDENPDKEIRDRVRAVVLSELNDLRRWVSEVFC